MRMMGMHNGINNDVFFNFKYSYIKVNLTAGLFFTAILSQFLEGFA